MLQVTAGFPEANRGEFFNSGSFAGSAGFCGVARSFDFDGKEKLCSRQCGQLLGFVGERGFVVWLVLNPSHFDLIEVRDIQAKAIIVGFDPEDVRAFVVGVFSPAILPAAEGVVGRESSLNEEDEKGESPEAMICHLHRAFVGR